MDYRFIELNGIFMEIADKMLYGYLISGVKFVSFLTAKVCRSIWVSVLGILCVSFLILSALSAQYAKDHVEVANTFGMSVGCMIFFVRIWTLARSPATVCQTLFIDFADFRCNHHRQSRALEVLSEGHRHVERVMHILQGAGIFNVATWLILPLFPLIYRFSNGTSYDEISKHFPSVLTINTEWGNREIRYLYELSLCFTLVPFWAVSTALYYALVHMIHVQYSILTDSIKFSTSASNERCEPMRIDHFVQDQLKLRRISRQLRHHLSPLLAATLVNSVFSISLNLTSLLTQAESSSQNGALVAYSKFVVYFFVTVSEITMYCLLSEKLNACNSSVAAALYETNWNSMKGNSSKQNWLLPMVICRREIRLYASDMVPLRIGTAVEILKFSYSYCAILTNRKY